jgi:hypothetical protein
MKYRNTIIWLVILLVLGAYVYYFERTPIEETENGERRITLFPNFDPAKVSEFSIVGTDTVQTILCTQNKDSSWNLRSPVSAKADSLEVNTFLSEFKDLKSDRALKNNLQSLSAYDLDTPHQTIFLKTSDKTGGGKLFVGVQNPDGNGYYVKKENDPAIYLISSAAVNQWNKSPTDFRDKTVAEFPPDQITQLTLTYPNQSLVIKKENEDWKLIQPKLMDADRYKVEDLLWKLHSLQIKQFIDESPKDLKIYGLINPSAKIILADKNKKTYTLSLGDMTKTGDAIYGKTDANPVVFSLDTDVLSYVRLNEKDLIAVNTTKEKK